jgi:hypothetical protein
MKTIILNLPDEDLRALQLIARERNQRVEEVIEEWIKSHIYIPQMELLRARGV